MLRWHRPKDLGYWRRNFPSRITFGVIYYRLNETGWLAHYREQEPLAAVRWVPMRWRLSGYCLIVNQGVRDIDKQTQAQGSVSRRRLRVVDD